MAGGKGGGVQVPAWWDMLLRLEALPPLLVVHGSEDTEDLVALALQVLRRRFPGNWRRQNLRECTPEELLAHTATLTLFGLSGLSGGGVEVGSGGRQVVVLEELRAWKGEQWDRFLRGLAAGHPVRFVMVVGGEWVGRRSPFSKQFREVVGRRGWVLSLGRVSEGDRRKLMRWLAGEMGVEVEGEAEELLMLATEGNLLLIRNELRKVKGLYPDCRRVERVHLERVLGFQERYSLFQWMDALAAGLRAEVLAIARYMAQNPREFPFLKVGKMTYQLFLLADLVLAEVGQDGGGKGGSGKGRSIGIREIQQRLGVSWWWARQVSQVVRHYRWEEVRRALRIVYQLYWRAMGLDGYSVMHDELMHELGVRLAYVGYASASLEEGEEVGGTSTGSGQTGS